MVIIKRISVLLLSGFASVAHAEKTFVYCSEGSPKIFNPQLATDGPTFNASSRTIYNRLVQFESGGTKIIPSLAESWVISKDALTYTFTLRKDVKFHTTKYFKPQRLLNADDILFSFNRMREKDHPYHNVNNGTYEYWKSMDMDKTIKSIEKVDDYKVRFVLNHPDSPFLANLAMDYSSILSAEYGAFLREEGNLKKIDLEPIGTGPFKFKKYIQDSTIRFEANTDYFRGTPKISELVFQITPDATVRAQKLKAGECNLIAEPAPSDIEFLKKEANVVTIEKEGLNVGYLAMNVEKKPLDNIYVRKAIYHALNRSSYIQAIYLGQAKVAKNPIPPSMWAYNDQVKDYDYDIKKAKEFLAKAGMPDGFSIELWTLPISRPYNPNGKKMGELIQADLARVGIKVNLVTYKWETYLAKASKGEHQMLQLGWQGDNGDPDNFLGVLLSCTGVGAGSNYARWCDKNFTQLIDDGKKVSEMKKRKELYFRAQEIFNKEVPWIPIAHSRVFRALSKNVTGYSLSPFGTESFENLDLK